MLRLERGESSLPMGLCLPWLVGPGPGVTGLRAAFRDYKCGKAQKLYPCLTRNASTTREEYKYRQHCLKAVHLSFLIIEK